MSEEASLHKARIVWTGAAQGATETYEGYSRDYEVSFDGGATLPGSSAPSSFGDPSRVDPERMLVAAASSCHMLVFLAVAARKRIAVTVYEDDAEGVMETQDGVTRVTRITLRPHVKVRGEVDRAKLDRTNHLAHEHCIIANSIRSEIVVEPTYAAE